MREQLFLLAVVSLCVSAEWKNWQTVPDCPLEVHPDAGTMYITRDPLGNPLERTCPPGTVFSHTMCACALKSAEKCTMRPSRLGPHWYEEQLFDDWITRPCGPGTAFNPTTCDCSIFN